MNWHYSLFVILFLASSPFATLIAEQSTDKEISVPTSISENKIGMANPAAVYCIELGYGYKITKGPLGEYGTCIFPDKTECEEWQFLAGKCGQSHSYCAKQGYGIKTMSDGKDPFSPEYAVCTSVDKKIEIDSVSKLFDLQTKSLKGSITISVKEAVAAPTSSTQAQETPSVLPPSFDWRDYNGQNWMTPVRDQGSCGSCWVFSTVGVVEALFNLLDNTPGRDFDLSEQTIVSCNGVGNGCLGGDPRFALSYIKNTGIPDEMCFPYVAQYASCSNRCPDWMERSVTITSHGEMWNVSGMELVPLDIETVKRYLIEKGPLETVMSTRGSFINFNGTFVYVCNGDRNLTHSVIITGYNDNFTLPQNPYTNSGGYWIIKNSWGLVGDGYIYIKYGECGVPTMITYAKKCLEAGAQCNNNLQCCSRDCNGGTCSQRCGDDDCDGNETCETCKQDCGRCSCGDGECTHTGITSQFERCDNCPEDCGQCTGCGDGFCVPPENCLTCPGDCISCCGDGQCLGNETTVTCPNDCGSLCGDGACNGYEDTRECPEDCGSLCGDWTCNGNETCLSCPTDCFYCFADPAVQNISWTPDSPTNCSGYGNVEVKNIGTFPSPRGVYSIYADNILIGQGFTSELPPGRSNYIGFLYNPISTSSPYRMIEASINVVNDSNPENNRLVKQITLNCYCGNGRCDLNENTATCPSDCPLQFCGDGTCNSGETCSSCPSDCGTCICTPAYFCKDINTLAYRNFKCYVSYSSCNGGICCNGKCQKALPGATCIDVNTVVAAQNIAQVQGPELPTVLAVLSMVVLVGVVLYAFIKIETRF